MISFSLNRSVTSNSPVVCTALRLPRDSRHGRTSEREKRQQ